MVKKEMIEYYNGWYDRTETVERGGTIVTGVDDGVPNTITVDKCDFCGDVMESEDLDEMRDGRLVCTSCMTAFIPCSCCGKPTYFEEYSGITINGKFYYDFKTLLENKDKIQCRDCEKIDEVDQSIKFIIELTKDGQFYRPAISESRIKALKAAGTQLCDYHDLLRKNKEKRKKEYDHE